MTSFLRKKFSRTNKVVFINETDLKPEGKIAFGRCAAHGVLYVVIELKNFQARYQRLYPRNFSDNT